MKEKFYETVKKYMGAHGMAEPGDCIAAGVSGGADSVCMLHLLVRLQKDIPFRLAVVHVNHGMRAEAAEDAAFVKKLCAQWGIPGGTFGDQCRGQKQDCGGAQCG